MSHDQRIRRTDPEPGAAVFCWGVWFAMTLLAAWFVAAFGPEVPLGDDYAIVPQITGRRPVTLDWLWSLHNEHRIPLSRLALLGLDRLSGHDFRAGMFATVGCLSALSALLMWAAASIRPGSSYADALFPIALLNWGHHNNLLWSWQITFGLSTLLAGGAGALILIGGDRFRGLCVVGLAVLLVLLVLVGAVGVAMVPPLALCLFGLGVARIVRGERRGSWLLASALPGTVVAALYFVDYQRPPQIDRTGAIMPILRTAAQFLALGIGPLGSEAWRVAGGSVAALAASSAVLLGVTALRRPEHRPRALGMLAVLGGFGLLTMGLAWGRAGGGERAGLEPRYVTLAAPIPCLAVLCWTLHGGPILRRLVPMTTLAAFCVLLWPNSSIGLDQARDRRERSDAVLGDLRDGLPPSSIISRHTPFLHTSHDDLVAMLPMLRDARVGPFRTLGDDLPMEEIRLSAAPTALSLARWDPKTGTIEATGVDPWATFALDRRRHVIGIRIRYDHDNGEGLPARFKLDWRRSDQAGYPRRSELQPLDPADRPRPRDGRLDRRDDRRLPHPTRQPPLPVPDQGIDAARPSQPRPLTADGKRPGWSGGLELDEFERGPLLRPLDGGHRPEHSAGDHRRIPRPCDRGPRLRLATEVVPVGLEGPHRQLDRLRPPIQRITGLAHVLLRNPIRQEEVAPVGGLDRVVLDRLPRRVAGDDRLDDDFGVRPLDQRRPRPGRGRGRAGARLGLRLDDDGSPDRETGPARINWRFDAIDGRGGDDWD